MHKILLSGVSIVAAVVPIKNMTVEIVPEPIPSFVILASAMTKAGRIAVLTYT